MLVEHIIFEEPLEEGPHDPSIFKAIFLAGGPGSGKSYVSKKAAFKSLGFKIINNDTAFEKYLSDAGLEANPENIFSPQGQELRVKAKEITNKQMALYLNGDLGLVIDGTGKDYDKITRQAKKLEEMGYSTMMIFVNTDINTSLDRNRKRARTIPDEQVTKMWNEVQTNIGKFSSFFDNNMIIIDNSDGTDTDSQIARLFKKVLKWANVAASKYPKRA
jgi:dephospho-CoA kinase